MTAHALLWCGFAKGDGASDDFVASVHDLELACRAAKALGIAPANIHAFMCRTDLLPADFRGSRHLATRAELSSVLHNLRPEDALFFVATNHGVPQGLLTSERVDEFEEDNLTPRQLSPGELRKMLDGREGAQILVIAACHAGIFLDLGGEKRTVIAACSADETYRWEDKERPCSPLLPELFGAWTGTTFEGRPEPPRKPALKAAFEATKVRLANGYEGHPTRTPLWSGEASWPAPVKR